MSEDNGLSDPNSVANDNPDGGTKLHENEVMLRSPLVQSLTFNDKVFMVSAGQPFNLPVACWRSDVPEFWNMAAYCGRKKTKPVAEYFIERCGGKGHMFDPYAFSSSPDELNFCFGVDVTLSAIGRVFPLQLVFAQGSNLMGNNWWIGGPTVTYDDPKSKTPKIVIPYGGNQKLTLDLSSDKPWVFVITESSDAN